MNPETFNIFFYFLPEIALAASAIILNILNSGEKVNRYSYHIFLSGTALSLIFSLSQAYFFPQQLFSGAFSADHYSYGAKVILSSAILFSAAVLNSSKTSPNKLVLQLVSFTGVLMMTGVSNIFIFFFAVQVILIPFYLLIHNFIKPVKKYYVTGSIFSGVMLYGFTLLYGLTGKTNFTDIAYSLSFDPVNSLVLNLAIVLIFTGIFFFTLSVPVNIISPAIAGKTDLSAVFHFTVIISAAVLFSAARFIFTVLHDLNNFLMIPGEINFQPEVNWKLLIIIVSCCSVIAGNFVLLWTYDLKKIFSFIIISQTGFLFIALISGTLNGVAVFITGLTVFAVNSAGIIYCLKVIAENHNAVKTSDLKGLGKHDKLIFISFVYFLASSAGFPLTAGFNLRLMFFSQPGINDISWLPPVSIISSLVFIYFIYKLTALIFSSASTARDNKKGTYRHFILLILLFYSIFASIFISPVIDWAKYCSNFIGIQ